MPAPIAEISLGQRSGEEKVQDSVVECCLAWLPEENFTGIVIYSIVIKL